MKTAIAFALLLTITFVVLKLLHCISWQWLWIFSPIWLPCVMMSVAIICLAFASSVIKDKDNL
jgi:hypothetical protein